MKVRKGSNIQIRRLHSYEGGLIMTGDDTVENARKIIDQSNEKRIRDGWIQKPEQYQICCHEWYVYEDDAGVFLQDRRIYGRHRAVPCMACLTLAHGTSAGDPVASARRWRKRGKNMDKRTFTVTLEIEATSEEQILDTFGLGRIIDSRYCESFEIIDPAKRHRQVRIRRGKLFGADQFLLESKWSDEGDDEWSLEEAYEIGEHDQINYHILGKIKDYKRNWGITIDII